MATKIARLVAFGLLFVGLYEGFVILEEDTRPGPPAALDHCSLHSSGKYNVEENVAALGHWLTMCFNHNSEHVENTLSNGIFFRCSK